MAKMLQNRPLLFLIASSIFLRSTSLCGHAVSLSSTSSSAFVLSTYRCVSTSVDTDGADRKFLPTNVRHRYQKVLTSTSTSPESQIEPSQSMTVPQLKDLCRERGLRVSGTKGQLLKRLVSVEDVKKSPPTQHEVDSHGGIAVSDTADEEKYDDEERKSALNSIKRFYPSLFDILTRRLGGDEDNGGSSLRYSTKAGPSVSLLPIQEEAYPIISSGSDAILHSPTGSGKTLAYVLPLTSKYLLEKEETQAASGKKKRKPKHSTPRSKPIQPKILVIAPSRELSRQVGKVWSSYYPTGAVAAVFGGAPLERHSSLVRRDGGAEVLISTPGRLGELIKEKHVDVSTCSAIVLDEADVLLDFGDQPEVQRVLDQMKEDYQLVLVSATIGESVKDFAWDIMEMEEGDEGFLSFDASDAGIQKGMIETDGFVVPDADSPVNMEDSGTGKLKQYRGVPLVHHWTMPVKTTARCSVIADLISTHDPRVAIVFVQTKAEAESMTADLSSRLGMTGHADVRALHGDMVQAQRSRVMAALSDGKGGRSSRRPRKSRVVVATDVASRGIDVPGIDLVVQCGVPRLRGKEGTADPELYRHRAGRAGRMGGDMDRDAHSVLLIDPLGGESKLIRKLAGDLSKSNSIDLVQQFPPTSLEVMEAAYRRASERCDDMMHNAAKVRDDEENGSLVEFFLTKLIDEKSRVDHKDRERELTERLACAMAALSGLNRAVPIRSLLTAEPKDRTVRVFRLEDDTEDRIPLTPPEVTRFCKDLGSGKMGRVTICDDGSAVFDLPAGRAQKLVDAARTDGGMQIELPSVLPPIRMHTKSTR